MGTPSSCVLRGRVGNSAVGNNFAKRSSSSNNNKILNYRLRHRRVRRRFAIDLDNTTQETAVGSGGSNATECVCPQFPWEFDLNPSPRNHFHSPRIGETENQYFTFQNQIVKNPILSENVTKPQ